MFCPNCGNKVEEYDNFCRYCGKNLSEKQPENYTRKTARKNVPEDTSEELVLYDVKKHSMAYFWSIIFLPVFFVYFWKVFLNTHSLFSWIAAFIILTPIIYPILRNSSDKIIVTTKYVRIKTGVIETKETDIPVSNTDILGLEQSFWGRMLNYGDLIFKHNNSDEISKFSYIDNFNEFADIIENTDEFIENSLAESE